MKYIRWALAFVMICGASYASQALAGSVTLTFDDTGYGTGTGDQTVSYGFPSQISNVTNCINQDTCPFATSPPDITTVQVIYDDVTRDLQQIIITSSNGFPPGWDSLFINTDYTGSSSDLESWDYLVHTGNAGADPSTINSSIPGDGLYKVVNNIVTGAPADFAHDVGYTHTPANAFGPGQNGRTGHANGINANYLHLIGGIDRNPSAANVGVMLSTSGNMITYDFSKLSVSIDLGDNFVIGYTPYCANDVVLVAGSTVPEPATMVLFGMGMVGLAGWRSRRSAAKK